LVVSGPMRLFTILLSSALLAACGDSKKNTGTDGAAPLDGSSSPDGADAAALPTPIALGMGYNADLAVDSAGTAYIAWVGPESNETSLQFCRLPRGATTCDVRVAITAEGTSLSRPFVVVQGMSVQVLSYRYAVSGEAFTAVFLFSSSNGGASFDAGRRVGTAPFTAAALGPGRMVSLVTHANTTGMLYQAVPLDGSAAAATTAAVLSTTHLYSGAVGLDGTTPVAAFATGAGEAQVRSYLGTGDPNTAASWSPARDIGKADRMHLAGGTRGLFLLAQGAAGLEVRQYDAAAGFGTATSIPDGTGEYAHAHMIQDATGRLHVLWPRIEGTGFFLYHARSGDGVAWQTVALTKDEGFDGVRVALAADQIGLAVWTTAPAGTRTVHAVAVRGAP
jgi:hypothetical protein